MPEGDDGRSLLCTISVGKHPVFTALSFTILHCTALYHTVLYFNRSRRRSRSALYGTSGTYIRTVAWLLCVDTIDMDADLDVDMDMDVDMDVDMDMDMVMDVDMDVDMDRRGHRHRHRHHCVKHDCSRHCCVRHPCIRQDCVRHHCTRHSCTCVHTSKIRQAVPYSHPIRPFSTATLDTPPPPPPPASHTLSPSTCNDPMPLFFLAGDEDPRTPTLLLH